MKKKAEKSVLFLTLVISLMLTAPSDSARNGKKTDTALESRAEGPEVVDSVIRRIRRSQIFSDDYDFMRRAAYMETKFGTNNDTFRENYFGGIWRLPELALNITKSEKLNSFHNKIRSAFDIDWREVRWEDLTKPLYCGVAMRLYLHTVTPYLPQTISKQARLYQAVYNKRDTSSQSAFINEITSMENNAEKCKGLFDLTIIMDGSGSVGRADFETSKNFVVNLFSTYSKKDVRKAFIVFGDAAYMIFPLDNNYTTTELQETVRSVTYPSQSTNTNAGILMAVNMIKATAPKAGVPSIVIIFTDGGSNVGGGVSNIKYAKETNITMFAIGIGPKLNESELLTIAYNDSSRVMTVLDFNTLASLAHRLNAETCLVSQKPNMDEETTDTLSKDENRYYTFPMPSEGLTITLNQTEGNTEGFYSFTDENPSQSVHDGVLANETTFIPPPPDFWDKFGSSEATENSENSNKKELYIAMEGKDDGSNIYTITASEGGGKLNETTSEVEDLSKPYNNNSTTENPEKVTDPNSGGDGNSSLGNATGINNQTEFGTSTAKPESEGEANAQENGNPNSSENNNNSTKVDEKGQSSMGDENSKANKEENSKVKIEENSKVKEEENSKVNEEENSKVKKEENSKANSQENSKVKEDENSKSNLDFGGLRPYMGGGYGQGRLKCQDNQVAFQAFPGRCDLYTLCACGVKVLLECAPGLYFDPILNACNFIQLVDCPDSPFPKATPPRNRPS